MNVFVRTGALILISTSITLALAELLIRTTMSAPLKERLPLLRVKAEPDVGWVMLASDEHYTYENLVRLNSHGFRGDEISDKTDGEYRILAIGDSHVYGQGVADSDLLTKVLEDELNQANLRCHFNVINMGIRAYSTNNEYALLEKYGLGMDPDHVILFFYINDFMEVNVEQRYNRFKEFDWYTFDLSSKPTDAALRKWHRRQIARSSALLSWTYDVYQAWQYRDNYSNKILRGESDSEVANLLDAAFKYIENFQLLSQKQGFRLTVATIPVAAQITTAYPESLYQSTVASYTNRLGLDHLDLLSDFQTYFADHDTVPLIPYDGHYNAEGQRVMGEALLEHVRSQVMPCH